MKIVALHHPYETNQLPKEDVVLILGFFDGLHLGHQKVIERGKQEAKKRQMPLALMTFNQHPSIVFHRLNREITQYLTSLETKKELLKNYGVDLLYVVDFTSSFAKLSPQTFVDEYIVGLKAKAVVCGYDYTYGPKESADVAHLPLYANHRFEVISVDSVDEKGKKISSTRIRAALATGEIKEANRLLGRTYEVKGRVVHGEARGRTLGFPTANIEVEKDVRLPKEAVYATKIFVNDAWHISMTSVGHNDTFGKGRQLTVETNILDFSEDIYGETIRLKFYHCLRNQVTYHSAKELIEQLHQDAKETSYYFKQRK